MADLSGHDRPVADFLGSLRSGRPHHAWLLAGPRGVGKAMFAQLAARKILADAAGSPVEGEGLSVPDDHRVARLLDAHSHPDFRLLERLPADPKRRDLPRIEWGDDEPLARGISVDQVRALGSLFVSTPFLSPWRVAIIDSVDDLQKEGANALLKNLEEPPPNCLFLLVSHAPAGLLPTIRSRCRTLRFSPLDDDAMASAMRSALPDASDSEIAELVSGGEGAPGLALQRRGLGLAAIDDDLDRLAATGDPSNRIRGALAAKLGARGAQARYELFLARVPAHIAARARTLSGPALADALRLWERARDLSAKATPLTLDPATVTFALAGLVAALAERPGSRAHG